jgi:starvation-inducible DNA-binding protein
MAFPSSRLSPQDAADVCELLQHRLIALIDLQLTLKHVHWNVVGSSFIGVHQMLDPQVDSVSAMVDQTAERIATLGGEPLGTPGAIEKGRTWDDYSVQRADAIAHLSALDLVYAGVLGDHGKAIESLETLDPVTQDIVIEQTEALEMHQWFVRAHLADKGGNLANAGAHTEQEAVEAIESSL